MAWPSNTKKKKESDYNSWNIAESSDRRIQDNLTKLNHNHNQARLMLFAKDDLKVTEKVSPREFSDLPTITCEIGVGREKKTTVIFLYR